MAIPTQILISIFALATCMLLQSTIFFRVLCPRHIHIYHASPPLSHLPYALCLLTPVIFHRHCTHFITHYTFCHTPFSYIAHLVLASTPIISMHFSIFAPFIPHHYLLFIPHSLNPSKHHHTPISIILLHVTLHSNLSQS